MKAKTTAFVTLKVEVHLDQPWGDEFSTSKILEQASRDATEQLRAALTSNMRLVQKPTVTMVLVEENGSAP